MALWVHTNINYFSKLADSMPSVKQWKEHMAKYYNMFIVRKALSFAFVLFSPIY